MQKRFGLIFGGIIAYILLVYLGIWLLTGLAAFIVGVLFYPSVNENLSDLGTTWLRLAVAAGYAYFAIKP
jgi:hypothetical protein